MIPNKEKEGWDYLAVKKLSTLLKGIASKHHGGFYGFNCFPSFKKENKLRYHEKVCKNKDFSGMVMPSETDNI